MSKPTFVYIPSIRRGARVNKDKNKELIKCPVCTKSSKKAMDKITINSNKCCYKCYTKGIRDNNLSFDNLEY